MASSAGTDSELDSDVWGAPCSVTLPLGVASDAARAASAALPAKERDQFYLARAEAVDDALPGELSCAVTFAAPLEDVQLASPESPLLSYEGEGEGGLWAKDEAREFDIRLIAIPQCIRPILFPDANPEQATYQPPQQVVQHQQQRKRRGKDEGEDGPGEGRRRGRPKGQRRRGEEQERPAAKKRRASKKQGEAAVVDKGYRRDGEKRKRRETGLYFSFTQLQPTTRPRKLQVIVACVCVVVATQNKTTNCKKTVYDDTCGEKEYRNGIQMVRNMSCHRCKNRKDFCHLCPKHVAHRVCPLLPPSSNTITASLLTCCYSVVCSAQVCDMCMKNYYHLDSLVDSCPLCKKTCQCPGCNTRKSEPKCGP